MIGLLMIHFSAHWLCAASRGLRVNRWEDWTGNPRTPGEFLLEPSDSHDERTPAQRNGDSVGHFPGHLCSDVVVGVSRLTKGTVGSPNKTLAKQYRRGGARHGAGPGRRSHWSGGLRNVCRGTRLGTLQPCRPARVVGVAARTAPARP